MTKKKIIAFTLCILLIIASSAYAVYNTITYEQHGTAYSDMQKASIAIETTQETEAVVEEAPQDDSSLESNIDEQEGESEYISPIDFETLQSDYPDIYAWINIPGTDIDYPILEHPTDDTYYLNHNLDGFKGYPACIYTMLDEGKDFDTFNTIIYGHNMKDESMFGGLRKYRESDYLMNHRTIKIFTPYKEMDFTIFAAVVYSDILIPYAFDEDDSEQRQKFLDSLKETGDINSQVFDDVEVDADSKIITLSTCIGGEPYKRYLIEAVYNIEN